jgi:hypothetical protein
MSDRETREIRNSWPEADEASAGWFTEGHAGLVPTLNLAPEDLRAFTFFARDVRTRVRARRQLTRQPSIASMRNWPAVR